VKNAKSLARKCIRGSVIDKNAWTKGLLQIRNTPHKATGLSPAILLYGHPVQDQLPAYQKNFERRWYNKVGKYDRSMYENKVQSERYYQTPATRELTPFKVGDEVVVQNTKFKRFDRFGVIKECCDNRRYLVRLPSGMIIERNRRYLRPFRQRVLDVNNGTDVIVDDKSCEVNDAPADVVIDDNSCEVNDALNVFVDHSSNMAANVMSPANNDVEAEARNFSSSNGIVPISNSSSDVVTGLRRSTRMRRPPDRLNL